MKAFVFFRKMINHRIPLKILPTAVLAIVFFAEALCLPAHSKTIILEGMYDDMR